MDGLYCVREGNILFDAHYFFVVVKPISFGIKKLSLIKNCYSTGF